MIRYIIRGIIDGSLSVMGVVIGAYNPDVSIVISAGIAGALANGFSNILAAFSAEHVARYKILKDLERSMLTSLKDTEKENEIKRIVKKSAFVDGIATIAGGLIPLLPFFFIEGKNAFAVSISVTFLIFLILGIYIGKLSKKSILFSCLKLLFFAAITACVCFLTVNFIK